MTTVVIEGRRVALDPTAVLGVGGEATVYRHGDLAVKIYHAPTDAAAHAARAAKLKKLADFPKSVPDVVVAPTAIVHEARRTGAAIGYAMPVVDGAFEIARLTKRREREGVISNERVMRIFTSLAAGLDALHAAGIVVGDLNDGNVLVCGDRVRFIDVDSMQFGAWPCPVAHERYLAPELFGVDLSAAPRFRQEHDWYAFLVLLFSALLYVHPFGGVHPKFPTMVRRVAAGVSLLSKLVKRPKVAADPEVLSDELRALFEGYFDRKDRGAFDRRILATRWTKCGCGVEHARVACPVCRSKGIVAPRPVVRHHGRCVVRPIFSTKGRIVAAALQGSLRWLVEEAGRLSREDGTTFDFAVGPNTMFGLQRSTTWLGEGERLVRFDGSTPMPAAFTQTFDGVSAFATNAEDCFRIEEDTLVDGALRIGPVVGGTTWIATGRTLGVGFYRVGLVTKFFVFRAGRAGLRYVELPSIEGRVRVAHAAFDDATVVLSLVTEREGRITSRLHAIAADGRVLGTLAGAIDEHRALAAPRGRCVVGGAILTATEDGLVLLEVQGGAIDERTCFVDTEPFVSADSLVLPAPDGAVHVVNTKTINLLTLT